MNLLLSWLILQLTRSLLIILTQLHHLTAPLYHHQHFAAFVLFQSWTTYFLGEKFNPACKKCDDDPGEFDVDVSSKEIDDIALNQKSTESVEQPFTPRGFNSHPTLAAQAFLSSNNCAHTKQYIICQPFPPPIPALTPLVNMYSLYHMKTLAGELDWGSTCAYCMRIDYEKYGCESCVWIKCFGDLHGYPDVDPYDFKKYLWRWVIWKKSYDLINW